MERGYECMSSSSFFALVCSMYEQDIAIAIYLHLHHHQQQNQIQRFSLRKEKVKQKPERR